MLTHRELLLAALQQFPSAELVDFDAFHLALLREKGKSPNSSHLEMLEKLADAGADALGDSSLNPIQRAKCLFIHRQARAEMKRYRKIGTPNVQK